MNTTEQADALVVALRQAQTREELLALRSLIAALNAETVAGRCARMAFNARWYAIKKGKTRVSDTAPNK